MSSSENPHHIKMILFFLKKKSKETDSIYDTEVKNNYKKKKSDVGSLVLLPYLIQT